MNSLVRTVLITGASAGIGHATAALLANRGYRVLAGTRGSGNAAMAVPAGTEPVRLDVTRPDDVAAVVEHIRETCPQGLFALINNAGVAPPSPVELVELDEVRLLMEVNVVAPLRLIQACLPLMRLAPRSRIINMSSMNGSLAMPMIGAYSASKFALEALSDVLRVELRPWGITVSVIRPGQVRTPIFSKALAALADRSRRVPTELLPGYAKLFARAKKFSERGANTGIQPEAVAQTVLKALRAWWPKPRYKVGFDARGLDLLQQTSATRVLDRILSRAMGTMRLEAPEEATGEAVSPRPQGTPRLRPGTLRNS